MAFRSRRSLFFNVGVLALASILVSACGQNLNEGQVRAGSGKIETLGTDTRSVTDTMFLDNETSQLSFIDPGDDFQITLISAFICDFREFGYALDFWAQSNHGSNKCRNKQPVDLQGISTRGEIAVLGGFQFRGGESGQTDEPVERVIFFSDDVRESGQLLNFLNIPVYGPTPAKFAAGRLKLSIIELDQVEAEQQAAFLGQIAKVGATFSSPMQGAVIKALASIGEAFIKANKDDRELAYSIGFDPTNTGSKYYTESQVHRLPLREGYLAVVRRETRSDTDHFEPGGKGLLICPERGLLVLESQEGCSRQQYYAENTWLLLRISKEDPEVVNAELTRTVQDVVASLSDPALLTEQAEAVNAIAGNLGDLRKKDNKKQ